MTTADKTYNGWTNYETWNVKLWMDNDQGSYDYWREAAQEAWNESEAKQADHPHWSREECAKFSLADRLKDEHEDAMQTMLEESGQQCSMWADLLGAALSEVNWDEIAAGMIDDVDKE